MIEKILEGVLKAFGKHFATKLLDPAKTEKTIWNPVVMQWANNLIKKHPGRFDDLDPESLGQTFFNAGLFARPSGQPMPLVEKLQEKIVRKEVPTVEDWYKAMSERCSEIRRHYPGGLAASFFRLPERKVRDDLMELAVQLHQAFSVEDDFFKLTVLTHLRAIPKPATDNVQFVIEDVMSQCTRMAIFTRTGSELSDSKMFASLSDCQAALQPMVNKLSPTKARSSVGRIIEDIRQILALKRSYYSHDQDDASSKIDILKLDIILTLRKLNKMEGDRFFLPEWV
jgi:hypothetical protein